jgi:hypothetical protein
MAEIYVPTENYRRAAEAIAALTPCPVHGVITADQVKIALGEVGNIWPESIRGDADVTVSATAYGAAASRSGTLSGWAVNKESADACPECD